MSYAQTRILFVFARLAEGSEETEVRLLARSLDRRRYRIDVVSCFHQPGMPTRTQDLLRALGVDVDTRPYDLSFEETVAYLARKVAAYDVIVSCQNVPDIYPALERAFRRPPLIDLGGGASADGPRHLASRYVKPCRAVETPPMRNFSALSHTGLVTAQWRQLIESVVAEQPSAPPAGLFQSFFQGGFECSTHRRRDGRRLDVIASSGHERFAEADYRQLAGLGLRTVRDGFRWHLIERTPGIFDWSSILPMLAAAERSRTQVVWDLLHYGWPDDLDIWQPQFVDRFARFARAAAMLLRDNSDSIPFYCPINEISFTAWAGGDVGYLNPFGRGRGFELKVQLVRAAIAAMHAILEIDAKARFVHCDPAVNIVAAAERPAEVSAAEGHRQAQFQSWDMLAGVAWPQLGGRSGLLDIVGVNYYSNNQWIHGGPTLDRHHPQYQPLHRLLKEIFGRYGRPMLVAETGIELEARPAWLDYVSTEVEMARCKGVPMEGLCLYPILNHLGWDDDRACQNGLLEQDWTGTARPVYQPLADELARQQRRRSGLNGV